MTREGPAHQWWWRGPRSSSDQNGVLDAGVADVHRLGGDDDRDVNIMAVDHAAPS